MTLPPAGGLLAAADAVRGLRIEAWRKFEAIARGEAPLPEFAYGASTLALARTRFLAGGRGALFVSMHHSTYFLMLLLAADFGLPVKVVTSSEGVEFWRENESLFPALVSFTNRLSARDLADCRRKLCLPFFMFDAHAPGVDETYAPLQGRSVRLSASWARIAARIGLDVIVVAVDHAPERARVMIDHLQNNLEPYGLVLAAASRFDGFMGSDNSAWEMAPIFASSPSLGDWNDAAFQKDLLGMAASDLMTRRALTTLLKKETSLVAS